MVDRVYAVLISGIITLLISSPKIKKMVKFLEKFEPRKKTTNNLNESSEGKSSELFLQDVVIIGWCLKAWIYSTALLKGPDIAVLLLLSSMQLSENCHLKFHIACVLRRCWGSAFHESSLSFWCFPL